MHGGTRKIYISLKMDLGIEGLISKNWCSKEKIVLTITNIQSILISKGILNF